MARVAIVGAGAMGLAAAYHAAKAGHEVTVYEADAIPGGMAAHFDFGGLSLERYYHFVCKADQPTFDLMAELGIGDKMRWTPTSMGYFFNGKLHDWGNPVALLKFPGLNLIEKFRYGLMMFLATKRKSAGALENLAAKKWIEAWCGKSVYEKLWRSLFDLKFYQYADPVSAAWIWTRIKRVGTSRRSLMQGGDGLYRGRHGNAGFRFGEGNRGARRQNPPRRLGGENRYRKWQIARHRCRWRGNTARRGHRHRADASDSEPGARPSGSGKTVLRRHPQYRRRLSGLQIAQTGDAALLGQCRRS
jgi:hypothetical protein